MITTLSNNNLSANNTKTSPVTQKFPATKIPKLNLDGILILDKPSGISSNQALQKVKRLFNAQKAGHGGSLDPLATGVLPIFFGKATKQASNLLEADKTYLVEATLGIATETGDSEGKIIQQHTLPTQGFTNQQLETVLEQFRGPSKQIPSMYSALKYQGQPLYKLARQGITVPREPRAINIYELILLLAMPNIITMRVKCSKGTYIRTLVEDIGQQLSCGAHVSALRRLDTGPYKLRDAVTIEQLEQMHAKGEDLTQLLIK